MLPTIALTSEKLNAKILTFLLLLDENFPSYVPKYRTNYSKFSVFVAKTLAFHRLIRVFDEGIYENFPAVCEFQPRLENLLRVNRCEHFLLNFKFKFLNYK